MTTGAGNDIERATELARKMVCEWGMSEKLGPLSYSKPQESVFLGREIAQGKDHSEATSREIDNEVRRIVMEGYETAKKLLAENRQKLDDVAAALLERETLTGEEFDALMEGRKLEPKPLEEQKQANSDEKKKSDKPEKATDEGGVILPGRNEFPSKA